MVGSLLVLSVSGGSSSGVASPGVASSGVAASGLARVVVPVQSYSKRESHIVTVCLLTPAFDACRTSVVEGLVNLVTSSDIPGSRVYIQLGEWLQTSDVHQTSRYNTAHEKF